MTKLGKVGLLVVAALAFSNLGGCATQAAFALMHEAIGTIMPVPEATPESYGTKLDPDKIARIKNGETTRAQVEALFGVAPNVSMVGDGRRMLHYTYMSFVTGERQTLQIMLDNKNVVQDHEYSVTTVGGNMRAVSSTQSPSEKK